MAEDIGPVRVVVLWAEEVRIAARALHAMRDWYDAHPDEEIPLDLLRDALNAASTAFNSKDLCSDTCAIMCAELPLFGRRRAEPPA